MLQDVAAGEREKFTIRGCQPKRASRKSKATNMAATPKVGKVVKAKGVKSTSKRDKRQHKNSVAPSSSSSATSSAAAQANDDADVMDYAPTEAVVDDSAQETRFEYVTRSIFNLLITLDKTVVSLTDTFTGPPKRGPRMTRS